MDDTPETCVPIFTTGSLYNLLTLFASCAIIIMKYTYT